jgi:hypothetical protein
MPKRPNRKLPPPPKRARQSVQIARMRSISARLVDAIEARYTPPFAFLDYWGTQAYASSLSSSARQNPP